MTDQINDHNDYFEDGRKDLKFFCPSCHTIPQDEVVFLCNHCSYSEMVEKEGNFFCPECFSEKKEKFMCRVCGSKEVKIISKI